MDYSVSGFAPAPCVWVSAFVLSLGCGLASGFDFFFGQDPRIRRIRAGLRIGLFLLVPLVVADTYDSNMPSGPQMLARVALCGFGALAAFALVHFMHSGGRLAVCTCFVLSTLAISWTAMRVFGFSTGASNTEESIAVEGLVELSEPPSVARTDQGRAIPILHLRTLGVANNHGSGKPRTEVPPELRPFLITLSPPNDQSNCHGWVFAGGRGHLGEEFVDSILRDNRYEKVDRPRAGDLIVYWSCEGKFDHTGLVKATGSNGFVLIESKWGLDGLFLHEPKNQVYGETFTYFRSPRNGHLLRLDDAELGVSEDSSNSAH